MKLRNLLLLCAGLAGLCLLGCEKDFPEPRQVALAPPGAVLSSVERHFFDPDFALANHDYGFGDVLGRDNGLEAVDTVRQHLLALNQQQRFVESLVDSYGYPIWSRSEVIAEVDDPDYQLVLIPLARLDEHLTSAFIATVTGPEGSFFIWVDRETLLDLLPNIQPAQMVYGRYFAEKMAQFDYELFGAEDPDLLNWLHDEENGIVGEGETELESRFCTYSFPVINCIPVPIAPPSEDQVADRSCPEGTAPVASDVVIDFIITGCNFTDGTGNGWGDGGSSYYSPFSSGTGNWWPESGNGGGGSWTAPTTPAAEVNQIIQQCNAILEPDIVIEGGLHPAVNEDHCNMLVAIKNNLVLSNEAWLFLLANPDLLEDVYQLAGNSTPSIFQEQTLQYYLNARMSGKEGLPDWPAFSRRAVLVFIVDAAMDLDNNQFDWLLDDALSRQVPTATVVMTIRNFLGDNPSAEQTALAHQVLNLAMALSLDADAVTALFDQANLADELTDFLETYASDNISRVAARTYLDLVLYGDANTTEWIADFQNSGIDPIVWDILIDQLGPALTDLLYDQLADLIPGGTIVTVGPDLLANIQQGNLLDALYNLLDIALNEVDVILPAAKVFSFAAAFVVTSEKLAKFYNAFKRLKGHGDQFVSKLYQVLQSHLGENLYNRFKWKNNNVGAELFDIDEPFEFWDDFEAMFPNAQVIPTNQLMPSELAGFKLNGGQFRCSIKYGGNTHPNGFTIEIKKNNLPPFKIRFK